MKNENIIGKSFMELEQEEMDFISGAEGTVEPQATPTISSAVCVRVSLGVSAAGASFVVSYVASATSDCD
ncbi:lichenicidin A2 family type 2 lantibiotic [Mammaliicoccus vitulinus]|uniref:lichenicidin A2 family type 2 lantibiotic n=1 Tax=Mammaliicoccus vitulinus TaxID=71237 RepID=UPI000D1D3B17|nr:lichenicidin A2 family type 2 lantibiotic [Mammaliicoccus vitulinus]PTI89129.1 type 2 lantibiotic [Mammaliicoccus vitulinus]